jgi:type I restriction enzyme, S subunit
MKMSELWETYPLKALVTKVGSGSTPRGGSEAYKTAGTPLIRSMNVVFFGFKRTGLAYIDDDQAALLDNAVVKAGDVLLNITGASIGRVTLAPAEFDGARVNQHVCIIRPNAALNARFLNAYLSSPALQDQIWTDNFGVTRQALTKQQILDFEVPVPPPAEQIRLTNQLDTLLTRIQACNDRFDAIPALLKRFRQTVTNAACSGELSAEWRGTSDLKGWKSQALANVCNSITDGDHQAPPQADSGVPFITISAMNDGRLRLDKASRFVPQSYFDSLKPTRRPARGDLLFSVTGSIGIPAQVDTDEPFTFQRHIAILKPNKSLILSSFIALALGNEAMRTQVMEVATGTAQLTIPLSGIRAFVVNLPPIDEQTEVVRRVEALFALADRIEARCTAARAQAQRLTPLVLAKAFRGELVAQDPHDEPASVLLARIASSNTVLVGKSKRKVPVARKKIAQTAINL